MTSRRVLPDTSIWIEFFKTNEPVFGVLATMLEERQIFGLECIFAELLQGVRTQSEAKMIQKYWHSLRQIDESGVWIRAGFISYQEKFLAKGVGVINAAIIAAARKHRLRVWTLDKKLNKTLKKQEIFEF